jgi:hypothetical protein
VLSVLALPLLLSGSAGAQPGGPLYMTLVQWDAPEMQGALWLKYQMYLRGTPLGLGRNVATFWGEYNGQPFEVSLPSLGQPFVQGGHAEEQIIQYLDSAGIPRSAVRFGYSDLGPCELINSNCMGLIRALPGLEEFYYYQPYPAYSPSLSRAVNLRNFAIRRLSVMELKERNQALQETFGQAQDGWNLQCEVGGGGGVDQNALEAGAVRALRVASRAATAATGTGCGPNAGESPEDQPPEEGALPEELGDPTEALDPGGIDFTSLQLRYLSLSGPHQGDLQYAMNSDGAPVTTNPDTGLQTTLQDSDAFFTWLTLPPSTFWVNLMPAYPPRIIDPQFGLTDAGRVLLQSDLLLKQAAVAALNPATPAGAQLWQRLLTLPPRSTPGGPCEWGREWIVPGVATVHATKTQLYILNAPLKVRLARVTHLPGKPLTPICQQDAYQIGYEAAYRQLIQPELTYEVNTAPQFEPLRRIYMSRVAAQWVRQEAGPNTAMGRLVDSGLHRSWIARPSWSPYAIWQQFLQIWNTPVYYTYPVPDGSTTVNESLPVYGGVDFSHKIREKEAGNRKFKARWRGLAAAAKHSIKRPSKGGGITLVGGGVRLGATTHRRKHLELPKFVRIPRRLIPPIPDAH